MSVAIDLHLITGDKFKDHFTMLADEVASFCGRRIHAVTLMPIGNKATLFQTVLRKIKNFFKKLFGWKPEAALRAGNVTIKAVRLCYDFINRTGKPLSEEEYAAVNLFLNRLKGKVHGSYQARIEEQKTKLFQIYNARHEVSLMKKLDEIELEHVHFQQDLFKRLVKVQPAPTAVPTSASMESVKNDFLIYLTMAEDAFQTKLVTKSGKNTESIYSGGVGVFEEWIEKKSFFTQWHLKLEQICEGKYEDGYQNLVNPTEQLLLKKYFIEFQRQLKPKHEKILRLPAEKKGYRKELAKVSLTHRRYSQGELNLDHRNKLLVFRKSRVEMGLKMAVTNCLDSVRAYWGHLTDFGFLQRCLGWIRRIIWLREILEPLGFGGKSATAPEATVARHLLKGLAVLTKPCANRSKMF